MSKTKKFLTKLLALSMALSIAVPAFADETPKAEDPKDAVVETDEETKEDEKDEEVEDEETKEDEKDEETKEDETEKPEEDDKTDSEDEKDDETDEDDEKVEIEAKRIAGDNRYLTAIEVSKAIFAEKEKAETVVLVSGENTADALAAGPLALKENAPILLATEDEVLAKEIERLGAKKIYIVGGENSVDAKYEEAFGEEVEVVRLAGENRIQTSVEVAKELGYKNIILANAINSVDALASSSLANKEQAAIILTGEEALDESVEEYLEENAAEKVFIAGGVNSVSEAIEENFENVTRIAGDNRYQTAIALAKEVYEDFDKIVVVSGDNEKLVDALAAAPFAAKEEAPILLTGAKNLPEEVKTYLEDAEIEAIFVVGGENTVANEVCEAILDIYEVEDESDEETDKPAEDETEKPAEDEKDEETKEDEAEKPAEDDKTDADEETQEPTDEETEEPVEGETEEPVEGEDKPAA